MILYVSDLDGTLLTPEQLISQRSLEIIREFIVKGNLFTIATARSFNSAGPIIEPLGIRTPVIVHNGAFIYDPVLKKNIYSRLLPSESIQELTALFSSHQIHPIIFISDSNNQNPVLYKGIFHKGEDVYINSRLQKGDERFRLVDQFDHLNSCSAISIIAIAPKELLIPIYQILIGMDYCVHFGLDLYGSGDWWLEISHTEANKKDAVMELKGMLGANKIICFGDGSNDISMFKAADESYAMANALLEVKAEATDVIGTNTEDAVALFLMDKVLSSGS